MDQRQGRFAFGQVVTEVLAALLRVGAVVEYVIDQLVRGAEVAAVRSERPAHGGLRLREHRSHFRTGLEELGRLAVDHIEVALLGRVRIVGVHQLQHFTLGDDVGRLRHDLHDRLAGEVGHHLEGA